jgi:hypothetical protein
MTAAANPVALLLTAVGAEREALLQVLQERAQVAPVLEEIGGRYFDRFPWEGDVLLARQIFDYEPARLRDGTAAWNPGAYRSTPRLLDLANALASRGELGDVKVHATKDYGSGEVLIDDLASELRQRILAFSGDIVGFEMEGQGILHAVWELQRTMRFEAGIAKGVADFGDGKQRDNKEERQRAATRNAAGVALTLLSAY